jgi:dTDP-4-amino-4,6-dideoxygalactose transaminase
VVVPAISFFATVEAVVNAGARPVFADVDPETWCITADTVEPVLSDETAALLPVHLFGNPAPVEELRELAGRRGGPAIHVLEDAAQAAGARQGGRMAGALGDAAAFSFYPSKNLGCFGDGGAIVTDDDELAAACLRLRAHGSAEERLHTEPGYNSRLDELQAAALRVLLPELDAWTTGRRDVAAAYLELGIGRLVAPQLQTAGAESCYHLYVVSTPSRDRLAEGLTRRGVGNRVYYDPPLHRQPSLARFAPTTALPGAERFAAESLALPIGPGLERDQIETVVEAVRASLA